jgi:hypothetical protein
LERMMKLKIKRSRVSRPYQKRLMPIRLVITDMQEGEDAFRFCEEVCDDMNRLDDEYETAYRCIQKSKDGCHQAVIYYRLKEEELLFGWQERYAYSYMLSHVAIELAMLRHRKDHDQPLN